MKLAKLVIILGIALAPIFSSNEAQACHGSVCKTKTVYRGCGGGGCARPVCSGGGCGRSAGFFSFGMAAGRGIFGLSIGWGNGMGWGSGWGMGGCGMGGCGMGGGACGAMAGCMSPCVLPAPPPIVCGGGMGCGGGGMMYAQPVNRTVVNVNVAVAGGGYPMGRIY